MSDLTAFAAKTITVSFISDSFVFSLDHESYRLWHLDADRVSGGVHPITWWRKHPTCITYGFSAGPAILAGPEVPHTKCERSLSQSR